MADINITAANVRASSSASKPTGTIATGVTVTQGQALYRLADGTIGLADSNGTSPANAFLGFALTAGSPAQPIVYTSSDTAYVCGGTVVSGAAVYLSNTPGGITTTYADIASGSTVIVIGVVNTDLTITINPTVGGVK